MLSTYIYHQLPSTRFGVCYTIFRETIELFAHEIYAFCNIFYVLLTVHLSIILVINRLNAQKS